MYRTYKGLDLPAIDRDVLKFWEELQIFTKSIEQRDPAQSFVFYEGPPSANGKPGIHHVMARTVKDLFCRYQSMQGKRVERKGGWDTHGLPIELSVEQELGITKEDIGVAISIEEYNRKCRETVMRYKDLWDDLTRKMGYWVDLDDPYITFENEYIESVWHLLKRLYDKGLMYKGYTIQPFSPAAGTGLSSHELNQPGTYREVKDTTVVAQFEVVRNDASKPLYAHAGDKPVFFLAWTTTPWTLPSNTALAVGEKIRYVQVDTYNPYTGIPVQLVLAKDLLYQWMDKEGEELPMDAYEAGNKQVPFRVVAEYSGVELEGVRYEQLMPYVQPDNGDAFVVLVGDFVSTEEGTGIVHIAPSFGADDMRVAKKYGIGALTLVDKQGKFVAEVTDFAGRYVKDYKDEGDSYVNVDVDICVLLKQQNKAFRIQKYEHNYPHCWRTDKPILYYPLDSWFIKATAVKDRMVELNKTINWKPAHTGEKRFGNWLENLQDWNLSRSRYWGIPLPIWRTEDGGEERIIGSMAELEEAISAANKTLGLEQNVPGDMHRPFIDEVILVSPSGKKMHREEDLIDVWFDSGAMPYAQWHYPFENEEKFAQNFPADFIAEGVDQTRGWFYTLHAIATMAFDSVAYKNVVSNGLVQDKFGRKMSKRLGNAVEPFETITEYGADATRWYMIANAQPWDNLKFDIAGIDEVRRKFFGTLYNTYAFFALYANIDGFVFRENPQPLHERAEIDRWVISRLHSLIRDVTHAYADYEPTQAARAIQEFVDEHLSNWYVRLCRRRFWKGEMTDDKLAAYQTLYECLETVAHLMAPVAPFFADWLYRNLNDATQRRAAESVHLSDFPAADASAIDAALEQRMDYAQRISSLALSIRKKEKLRVRQPLRRIMLPVLDEGFERHVEAVKDLILTEINVKEIEYITDDSGVISKKIKPNFKTLGKRLGKDMKDAAAAIAALDKDAIAAIEKTGTYTLELPGGRYDLTLDDFEISSEDIPGWQIATDGEITVALDLQLDDDLVAEGLARELVNRIQNIRKTRDFDVTDRIVIRVKKHPALTRTLSDYGAYIREETLADTLTADDQAPPGAEPLELVDDIVAELSVERV
jgi:isoleucyl-tRNA synthetase